MPRAYIFPIGLARRRISWRRLVARGTTRFDDARHDRLRQDAAQPVIDDAQIVEARQLGIGLDAQDTVIDRGDDADWQAWREDPAIARADDAVADLDAALLRQIEQLRPVGVVAGKHSALARAVERDRDVRIAVGQEQDSRG